MHVAVTIFDVDYSWRDWSGQEFGAIYRRQAADQNTD